LSLPAKSATEHTSVTREEHVSDVLFPHDQGGIPLDVRRVLVQLLLGPSIDARRQTRLWPVLLRHESIVRSRLHELFLELVVDRDQEVAFTKQVLSDELEIPVLLRRAPLTFLDSVLILFLRQRLTQSDAQGERAVLADQEIEEHLAVFERKGNVDHARFQQQIENAIEKAKKHSLLQKIRGSEDRYEVSPTLKLLFPAEEIQALNVVYTRLIAADQKMGLGEEDVVSAGEGEDR